MSLGWHALKRAVCCMLLGVALLLAFVGCAGREVSDRVQRVQAASEEVPAAGPAQAQEGAGPSELATPAAPQPGMPAAREHTASAERVDARGSGAQLDHSVAEGSGGSSLGEAFVTRRAAPMVEELLEDGLYLAGASPVHLALRGTVGAATVRVSGIGLVRRGLSGVIPRELGSLTQLQRLGLDQSAAGAVPPRSSKPMVVGSNPAGGAGPPCKPGPRVGRCRATTLASHTRSHPP